MSGTIQIKLIPLNSDHHQVLINNLITLLGCKLVNRRICMVVLVDQSYPDSRFDVEVYRDDEQFETVPGGQYYGTFFPDNGGVARHVFIGNQVVLPKRR